MENLFVLKGQLQQVYAKYSNIIDKGAQFVVALLTFFMINSNLGYFSMLANPVIALGLSVICAFLPPVTMALFAAGLIVAHLYAVSIGLLIVVAVVFLLMFIFYVRFTPKMAMIIILTVLAFLLKVPYVAPIACGLLMTPISAVPVSFGTITYFMIQYVKDAASSLKDAEEGAFISDIGSCAKGIFQNKEMWVTVIAFIICVLLVYNLRRVSMAHPWKVAIGAGAIANIVFIAAGGIAFGVHASYGMLIIGNVVAVLVGFVLEIAFFSVDYSRSETLQYEDDEYYYYVKAVPKITVAAPEKQRKKITAREDLSDETQIIDAGEKRKNAKAGKKNTAENNNKPSKEADVKKKRAPQGKRNEAANNAEQLLLTQSLEKELKLNKKKK